MLAGALVTFNAPATQAHYSQCPPGHFCIWQHSIYEGRFFSSPNSRPNVGSYMNDRTSSVWNRTSRTVCMNRHEGMRCYRADGSTGVMPIHNDQLTSFQLV
ncbi:peptidase inhibitor family I36 protein [Streptomyces sp. NBC_01102]|uniref:peptidase inhibitor family I36 protein n=1 Tax=unclassified Streptomyces TaxID=2593676 RepID=UPI003863F461|nr:peptidase inhibitor family I36 protein [Streptomyces sp. NBC_01102]